MLPKCEKHNRTIEYYGCSECVAPWAFSPSPDEKKAEDGPFGKSSTWHYKSEFLGFDGPESNLRGKDPLLYGDGSAGYKDEENNNNL